MKRRWLFRVGLFAIAVVVGLAFLAAIVQSQNDKDIQRAVEKTRAELRLQGFKTDPSDFDLSLPPDVARRARAILSAGEAGQNLSSMNYPELMAPVSTNAAFVTWQAAQLESESNTNLWPLLSIQLGMQQSALDDACDALLAGPAVRFQPVQKGRGAIVLLPHLPAVKRAAQLLSFRTVVELHNGNRDEAWTNLFALTRLATAWKPEPALISHLVRFACVSISYRATWEAMQCDDWTDAQLAALQREWEAAEFLSGLPDTAAFSCAEMTALCRAQREEPAWTGGGGVPLSEYLRSPRMAWEEFAGRWRERRYRVYGTYVDEQALLLYFHNRELEMRKAIQLPTWAEMRAVPGITNLIAFNSGQRSRIQSLMNIRELTLALASSGRRPVARAMEAEAMRRVVITAIGIKRFQLKNGSVPRTLSELVPKFLSAVPIDCMDGRPLRYQVFSDGRFLVYSVGLDCTDDKGQMILPEHLDMSWGGASMMMLPYSTTDIVWPFPANQAKLEVYEQSLAERQRRFRDFLPLPVPVPPPAETDNGQPVR